MEFDEKMVTFKNGKLNVPPGRPAIQLTLSLGDSHQKCNSSELSFMLVRIGACMILNHRHLRFHTCNKFTDVTLIAKDGATKEVHKVVVVSWSQYIRESLDVSGCRITMNITLKKVSQEVH